MATATVLQFMQKTAADEALRQQLEVLLGVGDGDISSEAELDPEESAALKGERAPVVAEFAAKNGYPFSVEDLVTVVDAFQQHQSGQLSDSDLAKVLGLEGSANAKGSKVQNPLQRLTRYMGKTYLGVDL
ncbi:MAG: Nif11-like leader peptide family natural product precursor [Cyanobacteria bacterium P01_A01_bin.123]